jgi:hypothetical protein
MRRLLFAMCAMYGSNLAVRDLALHSVLFGCWGLGNSRHGKRHPKCTGLLVVSCLAYLLLTKRVFGVGLVGRSVCYP